MVNIWIIFTSISSLVRLPDVVWVICHGQDRSPPSPSLQFIFIIWWLHRRWCIFNWQASILTVSQFSGGGVSRGEEQRACWPWTLKPQFVNISPCFLPSPLIFLYKPTLWRIRQLVVVPADLKASLTLKGGFLTRRHPRLLPVAVCVWSG